VELHKRYHLSNCVYSRKGESSIYVLIY